MAKASRTITARALAERVRTGRWRVSEYVHARGERYAQLVNTTTGQPCTRRVI